MGVVFVFDPFEKLLGGVLKLQLVLSFRRLKPKIVARDCLLHLEIVDFCWIFSEAFGTMRVFPSILSTSTAFLKKVIASN